jgi:hypothetical protein
VDAVQRELADTLALAHEGRLRKLAPFHLVPRELLQLKEVLPEISGSFFLDNSGVKGAPIRGRRGESVTRGDRRRRELEARARRRRSPASANGTARVRGGQFASRDARLG